MADWMAIFSAFFLVFAFVSLGIFIFRLGVLEARALMGPIARSINEVQSKPVVAVRNPFSVKLAEHVRPHQKGLLHLLISSSVPCYVTLYWGVSVMSIDKAVSREGNDDDDDDDDEINDDDEVNEDDDNGHDDSGQENVIQTLPVHRILSGSYESKGSMEYFDPGQEHSIEAQIPPDFAAILEQRCSQLERQTFPLVVTCEWSRGGQPNNTTIKQCDIVAFITAFRCTKPSSGTNTFSIVAQYIQIANGSLFPLKKLYISDSEPREPTDDVIDDVTQGHQSTHHAVLDATCVVCQSMPVSRVLLPCRHACVCGLCFSKLEAKCPMCRQWIQSYFKTLDEPEMASNELDTSREMNRMSALDLFRGVLNAS